MEGADSDDSSISDKLRSEDKKTRKTDWDDPSGRESEIESGAGCVHGK